MFLSRLIVFLAGAVWVSGVSLPRDDLKADKLNAEALAVLQNQESNKLAERETNFHNQRCTLQNAVRRRDWATFSYFEKRSYINAVKCLQSKPSITPPSAAPGAKRRYDDFAATHINQTLIIHETGNFFGWHRYLVFTYEKALREECGYQGYQPYWNWGTHAFDQTSSPVFDGSSTSLGGDGEFLAHNGSLAGMKKIFIPSGKGGGCVKSGPFKNMTVHLGPNSPAMDGMAASGGTGLQDNPRCLRRDISNFASTRWLKNSDIVNVILNSSDIATFHRTINGRFDEGFLGIHSAGHFTIGADADDLFSSPIDPAFWLHHTMLDRTWWIWQTLHPAQADTLWGTRTLFNNPPSPNTTLSDLQDLGFNAGPIPLGSLMNTMEGPLCYIYV